MRILAIRGENLASLAEPFALEFEQESRGGGLHGPIHLVPIAKTDLSGGI